MHIPGHMISTPVAAVTNILAVGAIAAVLQRTSHLSRINPGRFAAATSLIFAGQMLNFPVFHGTSGHLIGGVLAAAVLGIPGAILSITLVLSVQSVVFGDGGISALGANVITMALIGAGAGGLLREKLESRGFSGWVSLALAAWASVMMAALACSVFVALSGSIPFVSMAGSMLKVHALIGLGEALIAAAVVLAVSQAGAGQVSFRRSQAAVMLAIAGVMAAVSPWASSAPDGLEAVMNHWSAFISAPEVSSALLADYRVPMIPHAVLSTITASLTGTALVYALSRALTVFVRKEMVR